MLPEQLRREAIEQLSTDEQSIILNSWEIWARKDQLWRPGEEDVTLYQCGRGWGKTMVGANACHFMALDPVGVKMCGGRIAAVGPTAGDIRETMIEGTSGLLATAPYGIELIYNKNERTVEYPNGSKIYTYSGERPVRMRGPNIGFVWCDEVPHWKYAQKCWDMIHMMRRYGERVCTVVTTTPLSTPFMRKLAKDPETRVVRGSTFDNVGNMAPNFFRKVRAKYGRTKLGKQELEGEILDEVKGALWKSEDIQHKDPDDCPEFFKICISIDPAGGSVHKTSDRTGLVVEAIDDNATLFVLGDYSDRYKSVEWSLLAVRIAKHYVNLRYDVTIVGEKNFGGDMVETCITLQPEWKDIEGLVDIVLVTAIKSKQQRAAPLSQHYQSGYAFHVDCPKVASIVRSDDDGDESWDVRPYAVLEHQMTTYDPLIPRKDQESDDDELDWKSPDNMDALVHGGTFLLADEHGQFRTPMASLVENEILDELENETRNVDDEENYWVA